MFSLRSKGLVQLIATNILDKIVHVKVLKNPLVDFVIKITVLTICDAALLTTLTQTCLVTLPLSLITCSKTDNNTKRNICEASFLIDTNLRGTFVDPQSGFPNPFLEERLERTQRRRPA